MNLKKSSKGFVMELNNGEINLYKWQHNIGGEFNHALFTLLTKADDGHLMAISMSFPEETRAFVDYRRVKGYWDMVKAAYENSK